MTFLTGVTGKFVGSHLGEEGPLRRISAFTVLQQQQQETDKNGNVD
jgi:hypothetical protein